MRGLAVVLALTLALGPTAVRADTATDAKAKALYKDGMKAYDLGDFDGALALYSEAYKLTQLPGFLFNIAQCHRQLTNFEQAAFFYGRFIDNSKPKAPNVDLAAQLLDEMKVKQAQKVAADEKKAQDAQRAAEEARQEEARKAALDAPKVTTLVPAVSDLPPPPPPPPPPPEAAPVYKRWWFWTLIGVVVVGAAAGTGVAVASGNKQQPARTPDLTPDLGSH